MSLQRTILCGAKSIINECQSSKEVSKVTDNISSAIKKSFEQMPDFFERVSPESNFHKLSENTKKQIIDIKEKIWQNLKKENKLQSFAKHEELIENIIKYCPDETHIIHILHNTKNYAKFCKIINNLNKSFKHVTSTNPSDKSHLTSKFALMSIFHPENFSAFVKSKASTEILSGKIDINYLKNIKISDKIDEDFLYKLFDDLEKNTNEKLTKLGIDKEAVNKYLKICDDEVCKDSKFIDRFIEELKNINDPELANKFLKSFNFDENFTEKNINSFRALLEETIENPDLMKKILRIKTPILPAGMQKIADIFNNKTQLKITDELFDYYIKLTEKHPQDFPEYCLLSMNDFLNIKGTNEKMLKKFIGEILKQKDSVSISPYLFNISETNLPYLKMCLKNNNINSESLKKLLLLDSMPQFKNPSTWKNLDTMYNKHYKPICDFLEKHYKNKQEAPYLALTLLNIKRTQPEKWQQLIDSKLFKHIDDGKVNARILNCINEQSNIMPEILEDLQALNKGQSIIKKFNSTKDVLKQTKPGSVISVKGKMYINNDGKLERWNMTEEKFNELFPLVNRFSTSQGRDDCYLITSLTSLYKNPKTRGIYYKCFEQKGDDILVTIPAYKDYHGTIVFPKGEIELGQHSADAPKHIQMLERTYERTSLRRKSDGFIDENPLTTNNLDKLNQRIRTGYFKDVINDFLCEQRQQGKTTTRIFLSKEKDKYKEIITNFINNPKYIMTYGTKRTNDNTGHALSLRAYNPKTDEVSFSDPQQAGVFYQKPLNEWLKDVYQILVTRIK
ncbi:MAG: hypothetical protein E7Z87_06085 [Cyanobacteria bacterium SIG26]|nr:hypothetical protein [Cyanobacteria bacterium SIG26]